MVYHVIQYATYREIFVMVQNGQISHNLHFTAETHNSYCSLSFGAARRFRFDRRLGTDS